MAGEYDLADLGGSKWSRGTSTQKMPLPESVAVGFFGHRLWRREVR
jgi:hypothetical protein